MLLYLDEYPAEQKVVSDPTCLCSGKSGYPAKIHPVDFEKDDDSNFHMDFIVACSNLRLGLKGMLYVVWNSTTDSSQFTDRIK